jgi:hypothetical protein
MLNQTFFSRSFHQTFFQKVFIKHFIKMLINIFENVPTFFGSTFFLLQHHLRLEQISGGRRGGGGASQPRSRGRAWWRASTAVAAGSQAAVTSHDAPDEGRTTIGRWHSRRCQPRRTHGEARRPARRGGPSAAVSIVGGKLGMEARVRCLLLDVGCY